MNNHSGPGKLTHDSFYPQSRLFMKQKNGRLLSFAWVILVLSLMIFPATCHTSNGEDLVEAAYTGNLSKVRALLRKGIDVDAKDSVGATALMIASQNGYEAIVQTLLAKGAKIDHQNKQGATALIIASQNGRERSCRLCWPREQKLTIRKIRSTIR